MAIDPQFISLTPLEDFDAIGGEAALDPELRAQLDTVRIAPRIDYKTVRRLKLTALRRAFAYFRDTEWKGGTRRASAFRAYAEDQAWWLDDYALFRALHARFEERAWTDWPEALRTRQPEALNSARAALADDVLFRQYLQWIAGDQWGSARDAAGDVQLFGDLPFMVSGDSADVWARQDEFRLDASVGVPPDAFSETGQDWGLPVYRWDVSDYAACQDGVSGAEDRAGNARRDQHVQIGVLGCAEVEGRGEQHHQRAACARVSEPAPYEGKERQRQPTHRKGEGGEPRVHETVGEISLESSADPA